MFRCLRDLPKCFTNFKRCIIPLIKFAILLVHAEIILVISKNEMLDKISAISLTAISIPFFLKGRNVIHPSIYYYRVLLLLLVLSLPLQLERLTLYFDTTCLQQQCFVYTYTNTQYCIHVYTFVQAYGVIQRFSMLCDVLFSLKPRYVPQTEYHL